MNEGDIQSIPLIGKKLRAIRLQQGLSLRELAARAEVSASLLSKIENGKANPSVRSLHSISNALSLPITHFFPEEEADGQTAEPIKKAEIGAASENANEVHSLEVSPARAVSLLSQADLEFSNELHKSKGPVVRRGARPSIQLLGGVTWSRLTPCPEEGIEFMEICYEEGASSGDQMSHHAGRELQIVLEGELLLELGFEQYLLKPGDTITYDSTTPHRLSNAGQGPMRAISVLYSI